MEFTAEDDLPQGLVRGGDLGEEARPGGGQQGPDDPCVYLVGAGLQRG